MDFWKIQTGSCFILSVYLCMQIYVDSISHPHKKKKVFKSKVLNVINIRNLGTIHLSSHWMNSGIGEVLGPKHKLRKTNKEWCLVSFRLTFELCSNLISMKPCLVPYLFLLHRLNIFMCTVINQINIQFWHIKWCFKSNDIQLHRYRVYFQKTFGWFLQYLP